jgi:prepilin-type N-terminal cleavage/methylation domain-containing protein/prepilin-type processing-associated H-X9-DG protein
MSYRKLSLGKTRQAFTLIELLVVIAIIAILAAILFPVFAQARAKARSITCVSNVKQAALGVLMYVQDYDEMLPRLDNDRTPGNTPDWGNPGNTLAWGNHMFLGVVQPYLKNWDFTVCPEAGKTNWRVAIPSPEVAGIPYVQALDNAGYYASSFSKIAVNILLVEWGARGSTAAIARPAETTMLVADSVWDNAGVSISQAVGNTGVWPENVAGGCVGLGGQGWTWYLHSNTRGRGGSRAAVESGRANVAFADGHVKSMVRNDLERCDFSPAANARIFTYWEYRF